MGFFLERAGNKRNTPLKKGLISLFVLAIVVLGRINPTTYADAVSYENMFNWQNASPSSGELPAERMFASMVYDEAHDQMILFGGGDQTSRNVRNDMWIWDSGSQSWANVTPPGMTASGSEHWPQARSYAAIAYDKANRNVVLFGGVIDAAPTAVSDTWIWDGTTWNKQNPAASPRPLDSSSMIFDEISGQVILFGGMASPSRDVFNETWAWNGSNWKQLSPAASPSPRQAAGIAFDEVKHQVVLFGGDNGSDNFNDTWIWDGQTWNEQQPAVSPPGRSYSAMVNDGFRTVLFGGSYNQYDDTWVWDGDTWTNVDGAVSPPGRIGPAMAFNNRLNQIVLFGGRGTSSGLLNDTWVINHPYVTGVEVAATIRAAQELSDWSYGFTTGSTLSLAKDKDTITLLAPSSTIFPAEADHYSINDVPLAAAPDVQGGNLVTITVPQDISVSSGVLVKVTGVTNPQPGSYAADHFKVSTSVEWGAGMPQQGLNFLKPFAVELKASQSTVDMHESLNVTGQVTDAQGQGIAGATVHLLADSGRFSPAEVRTDVQGQFSSVYQAPEFPGNVQITAYVGSSPDQGVSAALQIRIHDNEPPVISLRGDNPMRIEVKSTFSDPGATAFDTQDGNLDGAVSAAGTVDTGTLGSYMRTYSVQDKGGNTATVTRDVYVVDTTAPALSLLGESEIMLKQGAVFTDPGAAALDNYDGDITSQITVTGAVYSNTAGTYLLKYSVRDSSGNAAEAERQVIVYDGDSPVITLVGGRSITIEAGSSFMDPGAAASDQQDGDLTDAITVTGSVNTSLLGSYELIYSVADKAGNYASVTRNVYVADTTKPVLTLLGGYSMFVLQGSPFTDPGATATDNYDGDITSQITVTGAVYTQTIGTYERIYQVRDSSGNVASAVRSVTVYDGDSPVITLLGSSPLSIEVGLPFNDPGASAYDRQDGDLTDAITVTGGVNTSLLGSYELIYTVADKSGNYASVTRNVYVADTTKPVLTLLGNPSLTLTQGTTFTDPGASASDNYDGDISGQITVAGSVNTYEPGIYTLVYQVSDSSGNRSEASRVITVKRKNDSDSGSGSHSGNVTSPQEVLTWEDVLINHTDESNTQLTVDPDKLQRFIQQQNLPLELPFIAGQPGVDVTVQLPFSILETLSSAEPRAVLWISSANGGYQIPLKSLDLPAMAEEYDTSYDRIALAIHIDQADNTSEALWQKAFLNQDIDLLSEIVHLQLSIEVNRQQTSMTGSDELRIQPFLIVHTAESLSGPWTGVALLPQQDPIRFASAELGIKDGKQLILLKHQLNGSFAIVHHTARFDDINPHWAGDDIRLLASRFIMQGVSDHRFEPEAPITRAEFTALLVRSLELPLTHGDSAYPDVLPTAWYADEIGAAVKAGWIHGYEDGMFHPLEAISREEMAVILADVLQRSDRDRNQMAAMRSEQADAVLSPFADTDDIPAWSRLSIAELVHRGLLQGRSSAAIAPSEHATRAEAAVLIKRFLEYLDIL